MKQNKNRQHNRLQQKQITTNNEIIFVRSRTQYNQLQCNK